MFGIKNTPLSPTPADPFAGDKLNRGEGIKRLTEYMDMIRKPFVLTLNSPWGSGKTSYVRMWHAYLQSDQIEGGPRASVFFNSWKHDFSGVPIVSLMAEIKTEVNRYAKTKQAIEQKGIVDRLKTYTDKTTKFLSRNKKTISNLGVQGAAITSEVALPGSGAAVISAQEAITAAVDSHGENKSDLDLLREELRELVKAVRGGLNEPPLYIFIDELDRCRPTYAIEFLETAKHLFDVEGVLFVLSTDRTQLGNTVKSLYGDIDAEGYLRRFIDLEYTLSSPSYMDFILFLAKEVYAITPENNFSSHYTSWLDSFKEIADLTKPSLRDIEKIFLAGSNIFSDEIHTVDPKCIKVILLYVFIKVLDHETYKMIKNKNNNLFSKTFPRVTINESCKLPLGASDYTYLLYLATQQKPEKQRVYEQQDQQGKLQDLFDDFLEQNEIKLHDYTIKKIEFMDKFKN